jgi:hypothetical protein
MRHFDSLLNAELHEVVPGKLVMMRCLKMLSASASAVGWEDQYVDGRFSHREFSFAHSRAKT